MDYLAHRSIIIAILAVTSHVAATTNVQAEQATIQFDMPAMTSACDTSLPGQGREISFDLTLSSLVAGAIDDSPQSIPPIDHLLVQCRLRDRLPVVDYSPKTELQTNYSGAISITSKQEQTDSFGLNVNSNMPPFGAGHAGADDSRKLSDSTEFQRQAPLQAIIASGTIDRGRGVYFKLRWTTQQVLEGEKRFQLSFAVPDAWRGGLVDVEITANSVNRSIFGSQSLKPIAQRTFVIAVYQQNDPQAAEIALRLAHLDRELAAYAKKHPKSGSGGLSDLWRRILPDDDKDDSPKRWYQGVTSDKIDPYMDRRIQSLPMNVRVAVLGYTEAARELMLLSEAG